MNLKTQNVILSCFEFIDVTNTLSSNPVSNYLFKSRGKEFCTMICKRTADNKKKKNKPSNVNWKKTTDPEKAVGIPS